MGFLSSDHILRQGRIPSLDSRSEYLYDKTIQSMLAANWVSYYFRTWNRPGNARINVILRHVRVTNVALEKQGVLQIICVFTLSYPSSKAHEACFIVICYLFLLYKNFPYYLKKVRFSENDIEHEISLILSTTLSEKFLTLRRIERNFITKE